jgi:N,N'-diacetyllegionaminate synthase
MRILGLVTARGGSKGFPGKNLARLAGRELVAWSHRLLSQVSARRPGLVPWLSTDDPAIAAAWPAVDRPDRLRPAALAGDAASSLDVVLHELDMQAAAGTPCDAVLLVQPTSPLAAVEDVLAMLAAYDRGAASVIAVSEAAHPPRWALTMDAAGVVAPIGAVPADGRRQDAGRALMPMGMWLVRTDFLREHRSFCVSGRTVGVEVPAERAVDIDHARDLVVANALLASRPVRPFTFAGRPVGDGRCLLIAEAGVNHNGSPALALDLVDAAATAGADVVKFQTFRAEALVTASARKAAYQVSNTGDAGSQFAMLLALELPEDAWPAIMERCAARGIAFLSSPFDAGSAAMLHRLGTPGFKLGSGELTNWPLLRQVAAYGRPLILSSGMADLGEAEDAVTWAHEAGCADVAMLHCVSAYPAPPAACNLRAMDSLRAALGVPIGWSDHSEGAALTLAAVARGAAIIEKHLTLDRRMPGPDHAASLEPGEFAALCRDVRVVEAALGDGIKRPAACEADTAAVARRSVVAARDLPAGCVLVADDLAAKRPGGGLPPAWLPRLIGRRLRRAVNADEALPPDATEPA